MPGFFITRSPVNSSILFIFVRFSLYSICLTEDDKIPIRIVLVGAGNVAWHLGHACLKAGIQVVRVINRTQASGQELAGELQTTSSTDFGAIAPECDFIIVAVKDSILKNVLHQIHPAGAVLLHTSGSHGLDVFPKKVTDFGVLYPFQTLTRGLHTDFEQLPLCIEASDDITLSAIKNFAGKLSSSIWSLSSQQRRNLHLSGIIINNFTNHLVARTFDYMDKYRLDKELIKPLLRETFRKLEQIPPCEAQTGPARRNDTEIIQKHLELLALEPELQKLYKLLTDSIIAYYLKNE